MSPAESLPEASLVPPTKARLGLFGYLIICLFFVPLGIFFVGFLAICVAPYVPLIGLWIGFEIVRKPGGLKPTKWPKPLVAAFVLLFTPVFFAVLIAPFRALAVIILDLPFLRGQGLHPYVSIDPVIHGLGLPDALPFALDLGIAACGLIFAVAGAFVDGFWRFRMTQEISGLPTSTVRAVALGLAELKGIARRNPAQTADNSAILEFHGPTQKMQPFYLDDGTGKIRIEPQKAKIRSRGLFRFGGRFHDIILTKRVENLSRLGTPQSGRLLDGDHLYVLGYVEANGPGDSHAPYVIRPQESPPHRMDFRNIFFLSDTSEVRARREIRHGMWAVWIVGLLSALASLTLGLIALRRLGIFPEV